MLRVFGDCGFTYGRHGVCVHVGVGCGKVHGKSFQDKWIHWAVWVLLELEGEVSNLLFNGREGFSGVG